jgi:hypothetical protein
VALLHLFRINNDVEQFRHVSVVLSVLQKGFCLCFHTSIAGCIFGRTLHVVGLQDTRSYNFSFLTGSYVICYDFGSCLQRTVPPKSEHSLSYFMRICANAQT